MKKLLFVLLLSLFATTSFSQAKKNLIGYWYKPKTTVNYRFYSNNTFEYSGYDSLANKPEKLAGTYKLKRSVLTLVLNDNTKQILSFDKMKTGNRNYYLKENDIFFIKDERVNNAVPPDSSLKKTQ